MSAPRSNYYPGFLAAFLLILLRIAIGWHFLYEGVYKIETLKTNEPFSSEGYLRNATGPLAERFFRPMVPDVYGFDRLDLDKLTAHWDAELARFAGHFKLDDAQKAEAAKALDQAKGKAKDWFSDSGNVLKVQQYEADVEKAIAVDASTTALRFERAEAQKQRQKAETARKELLDVVGGWEKTLDDQWLAIVPVERQREVGPLRAEWTKLDYMNALTIFGLTACGFCLILGFLTRFAALGAAAMLVMFYLSSPPWPGLPQSPMSEGHYFLVNKNLIELIACLALAALPTGHWIGLDAAIFGPRARRRAAARAAARNQAELTVAENAG